ncbi:polysaccharide biosynthesis tyrosine autokinase [Sulfitobacter sp.]|uniref:GumC family protein n=1 Tax=Sulfitobacter sp. TaxID=1903071 RepID=UPI003296B247
MAQQMGGGFPEHLQERDQDGIELARLFSAIWQHKGLILLCAVLSAALFFVLVSRVTPLYTARASVMLDSRSVQVLASDDVVSDLKLNDPLLDSEVAVLRSNTLMEKVVTRLGKDTLAPIDPALDEPSMIDGLKAKIKGLLAYFIQEPDVPEGNEIAPQEREMRRLIGALNKVTTVRREGQSYLIAVSVETPNPVLSKTIANTVIELYIQQQIDQRSRVIRDATAFLTERIEDMRQSVEEAESRIEDFRSNQVAETGTSAQTSERQLLELSTQLALAQADLAQVQSRYDRILSVIETEGIERAAELLTSPFVLSLRQRISETNRLEAELATRFADDYPDRLVARAEIEQLTAELAQEVRQIVANLDNDVAVATSRMESIQASVEDMEARVTAISRANVELRQLEREADAVRENYQEMLNRLSETRSTEELQRADARQVERALQPGAPSSPRVLLFTVFGATLGFAIGLLATFYLAISKPGFTSAQEIEGTIGLQVITSLLQGKIRNRAQLVELLRTDPYGSFVERVRQLRTVLVSQVRSERGGICIQMVSPVANESKTSTTISLAHLEARANRRCLVLDFDLRRSTLARDFNYTATCDLVGVLTGEGRIEDAIMPVESLGFDLITVFKPAPFLGEQLNIGLIKNLLDQLRDHYDMIVIDSAPVLLSSDSLQLASAVDAVVLLIKQNVTPRKAAVKAARTLQDMGAPAVAIAMTFTDPTTERDTYGEYTSYTY